MLHPAFGKNGFCGPAAIAALCDVSTDTAAYWLRAVTGRRSIFGTPIEAMQTVLQEVAGATWTPIALAQWTPGKVITVEQFAGCAPHGKYLIHVTRHVLALDVPPIGIEAPHVVDSIARYPTHIDQFRRRRMHVKNAYKLS